MRTPAFTALSEITGAKSESELPALIPAFFVIAVCFWSQFFAGFGRLGVGICRSLLRFLLLPGREVGGSARFPPLLFVPALTGRALAPGRRVSLCRVRSIGKGRRSHDYQTVGRCRPPRPAAPSARLAAERPLQAPFVKRRFAGAGQAGCDACGLGLRVKNGYAVVETANQISASTK